MLAPHHFTPLRLAVLVLLGVLLTTGAAVAFDYDGTPTYGTISLEMGFPEDPTSVVLDAGGTTSISTVPGVSGRYGYGHAEAPDVVLDYQTHGGLPLRLYVEAQSPTSLLVRSPNGDWRATRSSATGITYTSPASGRYAIWVGAMESDTYPQATLHISEYLEAAAAAQRAPSPRVAQPAPAQDDCAIDGLPILGRNEWAHFPAHDLTLSALIDSGATTSSLSAIDIQTFRRGGDDWVRFRVPHRQGGHRGAVNSNDDIRYTQLEGRVVRVTTVRTSTGSQRRHVIRLPVLVGPIEYEAEFNLTDRRHMTYPVLIGRELLNNRALINSAEVKTYPRP